MSIEFQQNQQAQLEIGLTISREKRSRMKEVTKISGEDELSQVDEEFLRILTRAGCSLLGFVAGLEYSRQGRAFSSNFSMLLCVDWDGVVCDSARETGQTGLSAMREYFSQSQGEIRKSDSLSDKDDQQLLDAFVVARPVLEVGWEAMIIMYALDIKGIKPQTIVETFHSTLKEEIMNELELSEVSAKHIFHQARQKWITDDEEGWLSSHTFFEPMRRFLEHLTTNTGQFIPKNTGIQVIVITTKGTHFTRKLVNRAGITISNEYIFGLEAGKKWDTLNYLMHNHPGEPCLFVEDRLDTLIKVHDRMGDMVSLFLVDYGYNTSSQRERARATGFITVISSPRETCQAHKEAESHWGTDDNDQHPDDDSCNNSYLKK
eukprot:gene6263-7444_t